MRLAIHMLFGLSAVLLLGAAEPICTPSGDCESDSDCAAGTVCEPKGPDCSTEMSCVSGCHQDSDCNQGLVCQQVACFTCPCPGQCVEDSELAQEGEACGADIDTQCAEGLYCAFGLVTCGTPPVVGVCRTMATCDTEFDCENPDNIWGHIECEGAAQCQDNACAWICIHGCEGENPAGCVENACPAGQICSFDYDGDVCIPSYCSCQEEGWACTDDCGGGVCVEDPGAQEGEGCGDDIDTQCAEGLYCAFGEVWCGTPPMVGVCRAMGSCGNENDCMDANNFWNHDTCEGAALCVENLCDWSCFSDQSCAADSDCDPGTVCEARGPGCDTELTCMSGCHQDSDCDQGQSCLLPACFTCPCPGYCE